ncbi:MAG TPA: TlpA disulfide reductase family protein [Abditibacteriaceae bacterium]|nr:TlpA disulfide reductase family protein [Abditibacteriaceae bacterium]
MPVPVLPSSFLCLLGVLGVLGGSKIYPSAAQVLPTPSVLLPGNFWDADRTPLAVGAHAPDFAFSLARDCRWKPPAPIKSKPATQQAEYSVPAQDFPLRFSAVRAAHRSARRNVTVLVFWAFWCDTWKDVTRDFKRLRPKFDAAGAAVACVAVDASQQPVARRSFASGDIWYPVAIDTDSKITALYGVRRVPTIFIVDNTGRIRARFEAFPGERTLMGALRAAKKPYRLPKAASPARSASTTVR